MLAAFSASLDGYQINLNGGIVSNPGLIRQFSTSGTTIIADKYISAWGGIQSAGQTIGQVLLQYATERLRRVFRNTLAALAGGKALFGHGCCWFVLGQLFASVALKELKANDPLDFRTPIYTQWAMIGCILVALLLIPEFLWWLASKGKVEEASQVLNRSFANVEGYDINQQIEIITSTIALERQQAEQNSELGPWAVFKCRNLIRFIISGWPKITQQFVGLAVFNTYATYFFQYAGNKGSFLVTLILSSVQLISMIATATLTDSIGRRPLTVYPYAVTVVSVLCLGIIGCFDYTAKATSSLLIFFACLATFSITGASAIGYAYAAEIPQQRLRAQTAGWSLAGVKTGFFFAGTGTVAVLIAWFILPEVARRTPAEIDEMLEKKVNLRHFDKFVTEVQVHAHELQDRKKVVDEV
ncbi:Major facilitator superfamily domain, general substrate transporter [Fusarium agapanthi]|uniref:Major facilitator superfamily domain, general substrate transporter n=1 Tax=Fusarium agapanthi TaxID=1803897 RepID=A0A9P5EG60_9HYPO|nr:Major facilitator superfamily domain, general substrate transporter [Fusarium agapanthi]